METFLILFSLVLGAICLIYGANFLVDGGASIARKHHISPMVIGLTIIALGTSMPELVVNVFSSIEGSSELAMGNVLGSNIFNTLCIVGVTATITPIMIGRSTWTIDVHLALIAATCLLAISLVGDGISRIEGLILLTLFLAFMVYTFYISRNLRNTVSEEPEIKQFGTIKSVLFIIGGIVGLIIGGKLMVYGAVEIAHWLEISERVIALTIVSIGTSLPELVTSVVAARKKNVDIAVGNVIGSNILNTFLILGISAVITPLNDVSHSYIDICVNIAATLLLILFIHVGRGHKITRLEGSLMLAAFIFYMIYIVLN